MVTLNPPARLAATSAAPGGCCSLLYHLFYLSNDGNAVGYKQSELGLDKNFGLSVCLGAPTSSTLVELVKFGRNCEIWWKL